MPAALMDALCFRIIGLPMALGAGFKLKEKEKDKEKDKDKDKEKDREKDADREEKEAFKDNLKDLQHRLLKHEQDEHAHTASTSGWTSVLEDWFCHGVHPHTLAVARAPLKDVGRAFSSGDVKRRHTTSMPTKVSATAMARAGSPAAPPMPGEPVRSSKGPYEMLVKERMMGLYLAVFVHRDAKRLVTGVYFLRCVARPALMCVFLVRDVTRCCYCRADRWQSREQGRRGRESEHSGQHYFVSECSFSWCVFLWSVQRFPRPYSIAL